MKRLVQISLAVAVVAIVASPALAQRGGGFGFGGFGMLGLLTRQESVQQELKLSADQVAKLKEFEEKQNADRPDFQGLSREEIGKKLAERRKAQNDAIAKILDAKQVKRAKQISWQLAGVGAINDEEVAKALKITDEQKQKIGEIRMKMFQEMRDLGRDAEPAKRQELMKSSNEKVMAVLTSEQKTKLKEMQGEKFTGKIERQQRNR